MTAAQADLLAARFAANQKSAGVAYLFWFLFGGLGAHRFYLQRPLSGCAMLLLLVAGVLTASTGFGLVLLALLVLWVSADLFLIPGMARTYNNGLVDRLAAESA